MKKVFLCLALVTALVSFAGCGDGDEKKIVAQPGGQPADTPAEPPADTPAEPPVDTALEGEKIANKLVDLMKIESQIPTMRDTFAEQMRQELDLSEKQSSRLMEILTEELTQGMRPLMVKLCTDYFTLDELRALRDKKESPELMEKMNGFFPVVREACHKWGVEVGGQAAQKIMDETEGDGK